MSKSANDFLTEVAGVLADRGATYDPQGKEERSMPAAVAAFNAIAHKDLTEPEGWAFMLILKLTRQWSNAAYHEDSALDTVGYSALLAEALARDAGAPPAYAPPKDSRHAPYDVVPDEQDPREWAQDDPRRVLHGVEGV